jgi:hypothetical protein
MAPTTLDHARNASFGNLMLAAEGHSSGGGGSGSRHRQLHHRHYKLRHARHSIVAKLKHLKQVRDHGDAAPSMPPRLPSTSSFAGGNGAVMMSTSAAPRPVLSFHLAQSINAHTGMCVCACAHIDPNAQIAISCPTWKKPHQWPCTG